MGDDQCSMDVTRHGRAAGAMTSSLTQAIREKPDQTYPEILRRLQQILQDGGYEQWPRLTSSQPFDPNGKTFCLCEGAVANMNPVLGIAGHHRHQPARGDALQNFMDSVL